jgi:hypothetical protein
MRIDIKRLLGLGIVAGGLAVAAGSPAFAVQGGNGWQANDGENIPTGVALYEFVRPCPKGYAVQSGGWTVGTGATYGNGFTLVNSGPNLDTSPSDYTKWYFIFSWPSGGAPSGSQIIAAANCKKGAP